MKRAAGVATLAAVAFAAIAGAQGPRGPAREIINVTGDLYRVRNGAWATIFLVTSEGIILGDPLNTAFSTWLKEQLAQRFKVPLPSACGPYDGTPLAEWLKSYRTVEALDFDVLAAGHGTGLFRKADVAMTREFFEDLIAAVTAGMQQGRSLEEMEKTILLEKYKDWAQYDRLRVYNIRSAYQNLKTYR